MKHTIAWTFLIINFILFSAENSDIELKFLGTNQSTILSHQPISLDEAIINRINKDIDQKYPRTLMSAFIKKEEYEYLGILKTIYNSFPTIDIDKNLIEQLIAKNKNFSEAIEYFYPFAQRNLDTITCDTLQYVEDSKQKQPISQLNQLPQAIKEYLMKAAYKKIDHSYIMDQKTGSDMHLCDVCPKKHLAATYHANKRIYIWDLKKNTYEGFVKSFFVKVLVFNPYEPQLIIGRQEEDRIEPTIEIWHLENKQLIHKLTFNDYECDLLNINFSKKTDGKYIMFACLEKLMHQWILEEEKCADMGSIGGIKLYSRNYNNVKKGCYTIDCAKSIFGISRTKISKKCRKLFLCWQAIKSLKTQEDIATITSSKPYKSLTEYECSILTKTILQKFPQYKE